MLEEFSPKAGKYIAIAESIAFDMGHSNVGSEHLLLSFLKIKDSRLKKILEAYKITYESIKKELTEVFEIKENLPFYMEYTDVFKSILDGARKMSKSLSEDKISEDVLMYVLVDKKDCLARELLVKNGCDIGAVLNKLKLTKKNILDGIDELTNINKIVSKENATVYKREKELQVIENVLLKKQKANVLLIGEAGVGKSALVYGLASNIVSGNCNPYLKNKTIYELDLPFMVAGTKYRGEFEDKVKRILNKVKEDENAILFIDEIHNIMGAGGAEGAIDASNILKPYLARKDISLIGATTLDEYNKFIEKDKAIERRFMVIKLEEVSKEDTKEILIKLSKNYESFYDAIINEDIIEFLVDLLDKYIKEKRFPDKAIDTLDYALVLARNRGGKVLQKEDILKSIKEIYKVDISGMNIADIKIKLKSEVIGQDSAIEQVCNNLLLLSQGFKEKGKPLGVYLFVGPPGVGKTFLAKRIAKYYFLGDSNCIKLAMENFSNPTSVSKILGADPGYVGHNDGCYLLDKLKMNPNSVVVLDEIEKASKDVVNLFLGVFDEGVLVDSKKREIDFSNTIIIMTSNLGFKEANGKFGFKENTSNKEDIEREIKKFFSDEFLNRIDEIVYFNKLEKDSYMEIGKKYLSTLQYENAFEFLNNFDCDCNGVRDLKRKIRREIIKELSQNIEINRDLN